MSADVRAELKQQLGADLVAKLSDAEAGKLHALLQDARRQQRDALAAAKEHALRFVPALLRKPLLKLMGQ